MRCTRLKIPVELIAGLLTGPAEFEFAGTFEPFSGTWSRDKVDA